MQYYVLATISMLLQKLSQNQGSGIAVVNCLFGLARKAGENVRC